MSAPHLVLLGPPGAGKGTQAERLAAELDLLPLSTGDLLRSERDAGTDLGREASDAIERGELVPDELVMEVLLARLDAERPDGFLLDGFPRTVAQARALEQGLAERDLALSAVALLDVPDEEVTARLEGRGREDDDPDVVRERLRVYHSATEPLVQFYEERGLLARVDGTGAADAVYARLRDAVGAR